MRNGGCISRRHSIVKERNRFSQLLWSTKEEAEGRGSEYSGASHGQKKNEKENETMEAVDAADTWIWKNMGQPSK